MKHNIPKQATKQLNKKKIKPGRKMQKASQFFKRPCSISSIIYVRHPCSIPSSLLFSLSSSALKGQFSLTSVLPSHFITSTLNDKCLYKTNCLLLEHKNPNRDHQIKGTNCCEGTYNHFCCKPYAEHNILQCIITPLLNYCGFLS